MRNENYNVDNEIMTCLLNPPSGDDGGDGADFPDDLHSGVPPSPSQLEPLDWSGGCSTHSVGS